MNGQQIRLVMTLVELDDGGDNDHLSNISPAADCYADNVNRAESDYGTRFVIYL